MAPPCALPRPNGAQPVPTMRRTKTWLLAAVALGGWPLAAQPPAQGTDVLEIDLPAAVRLADERNVDIAIYLARVEAATARLTQARLSAVPSVRVGTTEDRHEGTLQETSGNILDVDRAARFRGV